MFKVFGRDLTDLATSLVASALVTIMAGIALKIIAVIADIVATLLLSPFGFILSVVALFLLLQKVEVSKIKSLF